MTIKVRASSFANFLAAYQFLAEDPKKLTYMGWQQPDKEFPTGCILLNYPTNNLKGDRSQPLWFLYGDGLK